MILKRTIRYVSYFLALLSTSALVGSCGDDEDDDLCYKCTYDGDSETLCYSDYKDDYTKEEFKEQIEFIETYFDINCTKK